MPEVTEVKVPEVKAPEVKAPEVKAPEPKPQAVDLSTRVKVGTKEYSVSELAARAERAEALENANRAMFDGNRVLEDRKAGIRTSLEVIGMEPQAIENYLANAFPEQGETPQQKETKEMRGQIEALEATVTKQRLAVLSDSLDTQLDGVLDNDPNVSLYLKVAKDVGGPEQVVRAKAVIRRELRKATIGGLAAKRAELGGEVDKSWIRPALAEVLGGVLETVGGAVIGDPNKIGKAPETDTGMSALLQAKPVAPPDVKALKGRMAEVDKASDEWMTDSLVRIAAKSGSGNGSSRV